MRNSAYIARADRTRSSSSPKSLQYALRAAISAACFLLGAQPIVQGGGVAFGTDIPDRWSAAERRILHDHYVTSARIEYAGDATSGRPIRPDSLTTTYGVVRWTPRVVRTDGHVSTASLRVLHWVESDENQNRTFGPRGAQFVWEATPQGPAKLRVAGETLKSQEFGTWIAAIAGDRQWPELSAQSRVIRERQTPVGVPWEQSPDEVAAAFGLAGRVDRTRPSRCVTVLLSADADSRRLEFNVDLPLASIRTSEGEAQGRGNMTLRASGGRIIRRRGASCVWHSWLELHCFGDATIEGRAALVTMSVSRITWTEADEANSDVTIEPVEDVMSVPGAVRAKEGAVLYLESTVRGVSLDHVQGVAFLVDAENVVTAAHVVTESSSPWVLGSDGVTRQIDRVTSDASAYDIIRMDLGGGGRAQAWMSVAPPPGRGSTVWVARRTRAGSVDWVQGRIDAVAMVPGFGKALRLDADVQVGWSGAPVISLDGQVVAVISSLSVLGGAWAVPLEQHLNGEGAGPFAQWTSRLARGVQMRPEQRRSLALASSELESGNVLAAAGHLRASGLTGFAAAAWWRQLTHAFVASGRLDDAVAAYRTEIEQAPYLSVVSFETAWSQVHRAELFEFWGRGDAAARAFELALSSMPDLPSARAGYDRTRGDGSR